MGMDCLAGTTAWMTALRRSPSWSVLRTTKCRGVASEQTGTISRSHRPMGRRFARVAPVLPGSWESLPIAGGATPVLEFCLTQSRQAVLGRIFFVRVHPAEAQSSAVPPPLYHWLSVGQVLA